MTPDGLKDKFQFLDMFPCPENKADMFPCARKIVSMFFFAKWMRVPNV